MWWVYVLWPGCAGLCLVTTLKQSGWMLAKWWCLLVCSSCWWLMWCVCVAAFLHHMVFSAALDCFFFTHMLHVKATSTTHSHSCTRAPKFLLTYTAHNDLLCPSMVLWLCHIRLMWVYSLFLNQVRYVRMKSGFYIHIYITLLTTVVKYGSYSGSSRLSANATN